MNSYLVKYLWSGLPFISERSETWSAANDEEVIAKAEEWVRSSRHDESKPFHLKIYKWKPIRFLGLTIHLAHNIHCVQ